MQFFLPRQFKDLETLGKKRKHWIDIDITYIYIDEIPD